MARESFLDRWSRKKLEEEPEAAKPAADPAAEAPPAPSPEDDRPDEEILAELGLPHPETLQPGDDIRGFLQAAVPDRLRRLALRQLWRSNPVLANVDGLVEYGEDYTDAATVIENLQTVYQVGKGMVRDILQDDEDEAGPDKTEAAAVAAETDPETATEPAPAEPGDNKDVAAPEAEPVLAEAPLEEAGPSVAPTRRRMSFS